MILDGTPTDTKETLKMFDDAFRGEDYVEGRSAFMEKRKAKFTYS
jgi:enoyl-CoA hydratase/carnithine racemase